MVQTRPNCSGLAFFYFWFSLSFFTCVFVVLLASSIVLRVRNGSAVRQANTRWVRFGPAGNEATALTGQDAEASALPQRRRLLCSLVQPCRPGLWTRGVETSRRNVTRAGDGREVSVRKAAHVLPMRIGRKGSRAGKSQQAPGPARLAVSRPARAEKTPMGSTRESRALALAIAREPRHAPPLAGCALHLPQQLQMWACRP